MKPSDKILQLNKILTESPGCWKENSLEAASGIVKLRDEGDKTDWERLTPTDTSNSKPVETHPHGSIYKLMGVGGSYYGHKDLSGKWTSEGGFKTIEQARKHGESLLGASTPGFSVNKRG
jgi:hypothetical protein